MGMEHDHLALANRHIAEGEGRVADQRALIARMIMHRLDIGLAEALLATMLTMLGLMQQHRQMILAAIAAGRE